MGNQFENMEQQQENLTDHKRQRRRTTNNEKMVLENLLKFDYFPEDMAIEVLRQLQNFSNDWDIQRIRIYWNNNKRKISK